jgi:hypothetical protein
MEMLSKEELGSHEIAWHKTEDELPYVKVKGEHVAEGGTGRVYQASLKSEVVAVKMIDLLGMSKRACLRAARECLILRGLKHQNVLGLSAAYYVDCQQSLVLVTTPWTPVTLEASCETYMRIIHRRYAPGILSDCSSHGLNLSVS